MKVQILYKMSNEPNGGGNQFLKALKNEFIKMGVYTKDFYESDILLFNGHHHAKEVRCMYGSKKKHQKFVHRLDGLQKLYNQSDDIRQDNAFAINKLCSDGNIFQSHWIKYKFEDYEFGSDKPFSIIPNAVDSKVFTKTRNKYIGDKIKLVTTCWSPNKNKGFDIYKYIDNHLDFDVYEYHYIGNLPDGLTFENIITHKPMPTYLIAKLLPECDMFISAAKHECLSNSIIEAISCKVPCLVVDSGSNKEAIGEGGLMFKDTSDVIHRIDDLAEGIDYYSERCKTNTITEIANKYLDFFRTI